MRRTVIAGIGSYLPERVMDNAEISELVETTDEWIRARTGIVSRHIAAADELTSDLGCRAAEAALAAADTDGGDVDLVIVATATPDRSAPGTAPIVQGKMGLPPAPAFDINAGCAGFVYALSIADSLVRTGQAECALVIGAETLSRLVDWTDRKTCVLFGDGAGAMVLRAGEGAGGIGDRGILSTHIHADGRLREVIQSDGGVSLNQIAGHPRLPNGALVYKHAVLKMAQGLEEAMAAHGLTADDIDWLIPHQANLRILEGLARKARIAPEKLIVTVDRHGNTSAASIPLALDENIANGRIKPGDLLIFDAIGAGLCWGSAVVRL